MPRLSPFARVVVVAGVAAGCTDAAAPEPPPDELTTHEGVYRVATWTNNATGCDAEGPSVAKLRQANVFLKSEHFFETQFLNLNSCPSVEQCQADARDDEVLHVGGWGFQSGSDRYGWRDVSAHAFVENGACRATRKSTQLTFDGVLLRVEERTRRATFALVGGSCPYDVALAVTETEPCAALEVMTAELVADF